MGVIQGLSLNDTFLYLILYIGEIEPKWLGICGGKWHETSISRGLKQKIPVACVQVDGKKRNLRLNYVE